MESQQKTKDLKNYQRNEEWENTDQIDKNIKVKLSNHVIR